jgi:hypothetical protein
MKYIITESQYNIIVEDNNRIKTFQELINQEFEILQQKCESQDLFDDSICDEISTIDYIKLIDVEKVKHSSSPKIKLIIEIYYTFMKYKSYNELSHHLRHYISNSTGLPIDIEYYSVNTMSNPK